MKKCWRFVMALLIGSSILMVSGMTAAFARPTPAQDQGNGRDHGERDHGRGHGEKKEKKENRGQRMKWERDHDGRYRFNNDDRGAAANYFRDHRYLYGRERVPNLPLADGYVIGARYRRYCHPVPVALVQELPPPPYGYRYFLFNGNVVLLDSGYRVNDFIHLDINIGR
jgi:hypothetical protein